MPTRRGMRRGPHHGNAAVGTAIVKALETGLKTYLKGTNALADKIKPAFDKLPSVQRSRGRRRRQ